MAGELRGVGPVDDLRIENRRNKQTVQRAASQSLADGISFNYFFIHYPMKMSPQNRKLGVLKQLLHWKQLKQRIRFSVLRENNGNG